MDSLVINKQKVKLTNLNKILWPKLNISKGDLINYYLEMYPFLKEYLQDRPLSLKSYPDGITGKYYFQKDFSQNTPSWLSTTPIYSSHSKRVINWITINNSADLIWVANKAAIELHTWFSNIKNLNYPDFAVFDLDPDTKYQFTDTLNIALLIKKILDELKLESFVKTSGLSGLHIFIPLKKIYTYTKIRNFLKHIADIIVDLKPNITTIKWRKEQRKGKIYIDYRQNAKTKTLPAPYSLRPSCEATVSTPLLWEELKSDLKPSDFTLNNIKARIKNLGDLWSQLLNIEQELPCSFLV